MGEVTCFWGGDVMSSFSRDVGGNVDVTRTLVSSEDLNPERRLAVSDRSAAPRYSGSAGSVGEVEVKAEAADWATLVLALMQDKRLMSPIIWTLAQNGRVGPCVGADGNRDWDCLSDGPRQSEHTSFSSNKEVTDCSSADHPSRRKSCDVRDTNAKTLPDEREAQKQKHAHAAAHPYEKAPNRWVECKFRRRVGRTRRPVARHTFAASPQRNLNAAPVVTDLRLRCSVTQPCPWRHQSACLAESSVSEVRSGEKKTICDSNYRIKGAEGRRGLRWGVSLTGSGR